MAEVQKKLFKLFDEKISKKKLTVTMAKKVPIPGIDYSSVNTAATLEVEVEDFHEEELKAVYRRLYGLVEDVVDERLNQSISEAKSQPQVP